MTAVDLLDDQRGRRPRHNESDVKVRCGKVGTRRNVGDEKGGAKIFGMRGRGMGMSGSSTTLGNKMWVGTRS